jgi:hypothetical protein
MKESRVGCAPASHGVLRRGVEGGAVERRLPDRGFGYKRGSLMDMSVWGPRRVLRRHPIRWWRHHLAQDYDERTVRRMRCQLAKFDLPAQDRWCDAATGDAAAAIGIAFGLREADSSRLDFDVAMTALAVCAYGGSDAARVVIAKMLRSLPDAGAAEHRVADSWLEVSRLEVSDG